MSGEAPARSRDAVEGAAERLSRATPVCQHAAAHRVSAHLPRMATAADFSREVMFAATQRRVLQPFFSKSGFIFANRIGMVVDLTDGPTGPRVRDGVAAVGTRWTRPSINTDASAVRTNDPWRRHQGGAHVRVKKPASNWQPEAEEDEELIWERLRSQQAAPRERAQSEVVPRTRVADGSAQGGDPYANYAQYVQSADATPAYGVASLVEEPEGELDDELLDAASDDEDDEDEAVWERLRSRAGDGGRVSDVTALGAHEAWESEPQDDETDPYARATAEYSEEAQQTYDA
jgi:hypothetical protein